MEPSDIKPTSPDDDQLAAWYRANVSAAPLPDDGFSRRVLVALPSPAYRIAEKRRLFCLVGALMGTVGALVRMTTLGKNQAPDLSAIDAALTNAFTQLATPAVGWALGITAISLWFAFRPRMRLLPRM